MTLCYLPRSNLFEKSIFEDIEKSNEEKVVLPTLILGLAVYPTVVETQGCGKEPLTVHDTRL
jgi:hypothetical protein